ncbi:M56 family metallopeptidase [Spirosoma sp. KNUC1025]|uniref:M56 family metallopeptidase n=1 Tax=Spirosoma sp. KNUC1025 TaxID=2894082 RepID=UPI0038637538|nr:M56 family metallopeptidase [Spirosoma sp. KNUC1025]
METLRYVVLANGLLAVVSIAYYVLLRRETYFRTNRLALWIGVAGALLLPLLELPDWRPQPIRTAMQRTAQVIVPKVLPAPQRSSPDITITFPNKKTYQAFQKQQNRYVWSWQLSIIALYAVGVLLLLVRFGIQLVSLQRLIWGSEHESYNDFTLVVNQGVTSPFSFFKWVVVNPAKHTPNELEHILRHERVHVRELHSLDMLGAELICILSWFNPAAYLFRYLLHQTLEFRADHAVLAEGVDAKVYQYNLLKVSLSSGHSRLTNYFGRSQLKSRIAMLNQQESSKVSWLKYPVFFIAALTVASAFARPQHLKLLRFVPKPIAETLEAVVEPAKVSFQPIHKDEQLVKDKSSKSGLVQEQRSPQLYVPQPDTVRASPSRYMQYEGDRLYWIITPKTSFDDLAIMKQEFERHGYKMLVQTLKYDPRNVYISDIKITIIRPTAGVSDFEETGVDGGPIRSHGGYNGINTLKAVAAVGSYPFKSDFLHIPPGLVQIARNEELPLIRPVEDQKMEALLTEGQRKYGHLGMGFRKFSQKEIIKQSTPTSSLSVTSDGSLVINEGPGPWVIKAFINNVPVTIDEVRKLKISQLYTFAVILGYDSALQKRSGVDYFLFYVN